jgi:hypothetical protein
MAKTIKFNLICDEKPVRTIEDLQNNFSIEDVLAYYNNGLLQRWLRVRGYDKQLEAVSSITSQEPMEIIKELIRIFDVVADEKKVEESVYMLKYLDEQKELYAIYEQEKYQVTHVIENYEAGYRQLVEGILAHPNDVSVIKNNIERIATDYEWILELDHRALFNTLLPVSKLAIMCLLMNEKTRNYYLPVEIGVDDRNNITFDTAQNSDKKTMFNSIRYIITATDFAEELGENLITFAGLTDGYWKDLEPKGKRYMIVSMGEGDYVRSAGQSGGDLSSTDILNKFVIVDGVDYKSNSDTRQLRYMEV